MSTYARVVVRAVDSANSDYSDPTNDSKSRELTATPAYNIERIVKVPSATDPVIVYDASTEAWTTVDFLVVENLDSAIDVVVGYDDADGSKTVRLTGGDIAVLPSLLQTTDITLTADSGTISCYVFMVGT